MDYRILVEYPQDPRTNYLDEIHIMFDDRVGWHTILCADRHASANFVCAPIRGDLIDRPLTWQEVQAFVLDRFNLSLWS